MSTTHSARTAQPPPRRAVIVVTGGGQLSSQAIEVAASVTDPVAVIAADSGLDDAVRAELRPTLLVGDLDSISAAGRMWAYAHGVAIAEHPVDKDATDTELALAAVAALPEVTDLVLLGGLTGDDHPTGGPTPGPSGGPTRLDHLLGTLASLGRPTLAHLETITAVLGTATVHVVHPGRSVALALDAGRTFSLLALHGPCHGIELSGARWPLTGATLTGCEARGVSNVTEGHTAVGVAEGVLTVVIP